MKYEQIYISATTFSQSNPSHIICQVATPLEGTTSVRRLAMAMSVAAKYHPEAGRVSVFSRSRWSAGRQLAVDRAEKPKYTVQLQD